MAGHRRGYRQEAEGEGILPGAEYVFFVEVEDAFGEFDEGVAAEEAYFGGVAGVGFDVPGRGRGAFTFVDGKEAPVVARAFEAARVGFDADLAGATLATAAVHVGRCAIACGKRELLFRFFFTLTLVNFQFLSFVHIKYFTEIPTSPSSNGNFFRNSTFHHQQTNTPYNIPAPKKPTNLLRTISFTN